MQANGMLTVIWMKNKLSSTMQNISVFISPCQNTENVKIKKNEKLTQNKLWKNNRTV